MLRLLSGVVLLLDLVAEVVAEAVVNMQWGTRNTGGLH